MLIHLGCADLQYCALMAERRNVVKAGVRSNKRSAMTEYESHYIGMLGEFAVSKYLGLRIDETVGKGGDGKIVDLIQDGMEIQVKTRLPNKPPLYLFYESLDVAERTVCALAKSPATIQLVGWIDRDDFLAQYKEVDFGYGTRFAVTSDRLRSMERWYESHVGV